MTMNTLNNQNKTLFVSRTQKTVELYGLDELRPKLQMAPISTMIHILTIENENSQHIAAAWLLLNEKLMGDRREACVRILLKILSVDQVFQLFLALKKNRVNSKFATRVILRYIWNHPYLNEIVLAHSGMIRDILEHALGRNTVRGMVKRLKDDPKDIKALRTLTGNLSSQSEITSAIIRTIFRISKTDCINSTDSMNHMKKCKKVHMEFRAKIQNSIPEIKTVTVTSRGDISASLVRLYQGSNDPELLFFAEQCADNIALKINNTSLKAAMVLDMSLSTLGDGDRKYACISQSIAFMMVLQRVCQLSVFPTGGNQVPDLNKNNLPFPSGETDLASAYLNAVESNPEMILIVSDGYENLVNGDLDYVLRSVPEDVAAIPTTFIHSMFTKKDSLEQRRPTQLLPELKFWHENDFPNVCAQLFKNMDIQSEDNEELSEKTKFLDSLLSLAD